jgi:hypothetical protein
MDFAGNGIEPNDFGRGAYIPGQRWSRVGPNYQRQKSHGQGKKKIQRKAFHMKDEYDFTDAEQGKFYRPIEELDIPIYLEPEVKKFLLEKFKEKREDFSLNKIVNSLIKKDIEIHKELV